MKKIITLVVLISTFTGLFAGGLVTNTNQSSYFTRMMCRDATLGIDAVYYNPAGLATYEEGFYLSLHNQSIFQTQRISNDYMYLTNPGFEYVGEVKAPLFPNIYAAYKIGNIVISGGFMPIGGGGGAEFSDGLPSFEMMVADLVPMLSSQISVMDMGIESMIGTNPGFSNIQGYDANIYFKGSSIYYGYQANASYNVSDALSIAIGARLVQAKNTYKGHVKDVMIGAPDIYGGSQSPGDYMRFLVNTPFVGPETPTGISLLGIANELDAATNLEADVIVKGSGVTPILSVNYSPNEMLNFSVKYEIKTKLELGTEVIDGKDAGGMFVDGEAVVADMPAQLVVGAMLKPTEKLMVTTGIHYYFDKNNDYDGSITKEVPMIDKNSLEYGLGLEYSLSRKLSMSAGWLMTRTGVNELYQSDQRFSLNTNSFGGGFGISILENLDLSLGGSITMYEDGQRGFPHSLGNSNVSVTETYDKDVWMVSAGLSYSLEY